MSSKNERKRLKVFTEDLLAIRSNCAHIASISASLGPKVLAEGIEIIRSVAAELDHLADQLDPIVQPKVFFDPTSPSLAGKLISEHLAQQEMIPIDTLGNARKKTGMQFYGSGVYALYYKGPFPAYSPIKGANNPIYVGKSDPIEADAEFPRAQGFTLHNRLREHLKTLRNVVNLDSKHFSVRYLVVGSGWQAAVEQVLIKRFHPVWNKETGVLSGFGKHGDKAKTRTNSKSTWDTLHPGRKWAKDNPSHRLQVREITKRIAEHFRKYPPNNEAASPQDA